MLPDRKSLGRICLRARAHAGIWPAQQLELQLAVCCTVVDHMSTLQILLISYHHTTSPPRHVSLLQVVKPPGL